MKIEPLASNTIIVITSQGRQYRIHDAEELGLHIRREDGSTFRVTSSVMAPQELGLHTIISLNDI